MSINELITTARSASETRKTVSIPSNRTAEKQIKASNEPDSTAAIRNLIASCIEYEDLGDYIGFGSVLADAELIVNGTVLRGADTIAEFARSTLGTPDSNSKEPSISIRHLVSNLAVTVDEDAQSATAHAYFTAIRSQPGCGVRTIATGRIRDRFTRDRGEWRFVEHNIVADQPSVQKPSVTVRIPIGAPAQEVWDALVEFDRYSRWHPALILDEVPDEIAVGVQLSGRLTGDLYGGQPVSMTIVGLEPGRRLVWEGGTPGVLTGRHSFTLMPGLGGGTEVIDSEEYSGSQAADHYAARHRDLVAQHRVYGEELRTWIEARRPRTRE